MRYLFERCRLCQMAILVLVLIFFVLPVLAYHWIADQLRDTEDEYFDVDQPTDED